MSQELLDAVALVGQKAELVDGGTVGRGRHRHQQHHSGRIRAGRTAGGNSGRGVKFCGVEKEYLVGLIIRRSAVQISPPRPTFARSCP